MLLELLSTQVIAVHRTAGCAMTLIIKAKMSCSEYLRYNAPVIQAT